MFYKDEILARLANGEDAQAIADDLANTLNSAIQEHLDAKEAAEKNDVKAKRVGMIMTDILDFLEDYYPDIYDAELRDFDNADLLSFVEDAIEETRKFHKVMANVDSALEDILKEMKIPEAKVQKVAVTEKEFDSIKDFLDKYVNN
jgi:hypothetical protein